VDRRSIDRGNKIEAEAFCETEILKRVCGALQHPISVCGRDSERLNIIYYGMKRLVATDCNILPGCWMYPSSDGAAWATLALLGVGGESEKRTNVFAMISYGAPLLHSRPCNRCYYILTSGNGYLVTYFWTAHANDGYASEISSLVSSMRWRWTRWTKYHAVILFNSLSPIMHEW